MTSKFLYAARPLCCIPAVILRSSPILLWSDNQQWSVHIKESLWDPSHIATQRDWEILTSEWEKNGVKKVADNVQRTWLHAYVHNILQLKYPYSSLHVCAESASKPKSTRVVRVYYDTQSCQTGDRYPCEIACYKSSCQHCMF